MQEGKATAHNIGNELRGEPRKNFHYWNKGSLATIGRATAVADFGKIHVSQSMKPPRSKEAIYCQRARATEDKACEAGEIEEVTFIARRLELGAPRHHTHQLDRAEPIR